MATRRNTGVSRPTNSKLAPKAKPAKPARVRSAQKTDERVWNLTDWPGKGSAGEVRMIAGRNVAPGHAVRVPLDMLEKAKRLKAMAASGEIYIGPTPPQEYLAAKNRSKAFVPSSHARSHGHPAQKRKVMDARKAHESAKAEAAKAAEALKSAKDAADKSPKNEDLKAALAAAEDASKRLDKVASDAKAALEAAQGELAGLTPKHEPAKKVAAMEKIAVSDSPKAETRGGRNKNRGK